MNKRYTRLENVVFLDITSDQQEWQQEFVQELRERRIYYRTLPEYVEQVRMERKLDEMYAGWKQ